jgi:TraK protein
MLRIKFTTAASIFALTLSAFTSAEARDLEYNSGEVSVYVTPGEPTQIQFPGVISGGFKKKMSSVSLDRKNSDLIIFARENLSKQGEAVIVRLEDGRSYSIRIEPSTTEKPRDDVVKIDDLRSSFVSGSEEEEPPYKEKTFGYAPPSQVSGLMREMVLNAEFGKDAISGYRVSTRHKGETVLNDGTLHATIERIYIGRNLWGYVLDAENLLDTSQKLNPASFRLDGTRAVSAQFWELAPRPLDVEQQIAGRHKARVYIITKAK